MAQAGVPRIEQLHVRNYRALRDVRLNDLTPLTVLLGPNGSGKSTLFDVFGFLAEALKLGLRPAWDKRGRLHELRSRESDGPISFELRYRERPKTPIITYKLEIDEDGRGRPVVRRETLRWKRGSYGQPFNFLDFTEGRGQVVSGDRPEIEDQRREATLSSSDLLAVSTLGQLAENPRVVALREFIEGWYLSYLSSTDARGVPDAGPMERLSQTGDNLSNVIQYLSESHPEQLAKILEILSQRVPRLERVAAEPLADGRLLLLIKDAPFQEPFHARFASDGTLKMLAYLVLLHDPEPLPLLGIEEPENYLHPRLLAGLAEECRKVSAGSQVFVSTHSPFFVNSLRPKELWALERDGKGYTQAIRVSDMPKVNEFVEEGAQLGALWMEGHLSAGDPLRNASIKQTVRH
jgi:predicted ATPase